MSFSISKNTGAYTGGEEQPPEILNFFDLEKMQEILVCENGKWVYKKVERTDYGESCDKEKWKTHVAENRIPLDHIPPDFIPMENPPSNS
jgi:hypothetical protein